MGRALFARVSNVPMERDSAYDLFYPSGVPKGRNVDKMPLLQHRCTKGHEGFHML